MSIKKQLLIGAVIFGIPIIGSVVLGLVMEKDYPLE
jgi:hypothetical protein